MSPHPPAPWRLAGPAVMAPALVPVARAREHVPDDVDVVALLPRHTIGGLIAVTDRRRRPEVLPS